MQGRQQTSSFPMFSPQWVTATGILGILLIAYARSIGSETVTTNMEAWSSDAIRVKTKELDLNGDGKNEWVETRAEARSGLRLFSLAYASKHGKLKECQNLLVYDRKGNLLVLLLDKDADGSLDAAITFDEEGRATGGVKFAGKGVLEVLGRAEAKDFWPSNLLEGTNSVPLDKGNRATPSVHPDTQPPVP